MPTSTTLYDGSKRLLFRRVLRPSTTTSTSTTTKTTQQQQQQQTTPVVITPVLTPVTDVDVLLTLQQQASLAEFEGDYIVTSTNRRLEGIHRKNWWGFAGRSSSCDSSLHELYQESRHYPSNYLMNESRRELMKKRNATTNTTSRSNNNNNSDDDDDDEDDESKLLPFASCLVTTAGPLLPNIRQGIVHTCIPRYPPTQEQIQLGQRNSSSTLSHAWISTEEEAIQLLTHCYQDIFQTILHRHLDEGKKKQQQQQRRKSYYWNNKWHRLWNNFFYKCCRPMTVPNENDNNSQPDSSSLSICLPAIGCGYNGYPIQQAASIALDCIHQIGTRSTTNTNSNSNIINAATTTTTTTTTKCIKKVVVVNVEIRFMNDRTYQIWFDELMRRSPNQFTPVN